MKTSTKLLIALIACVPLSMVAYAYLQRQQFFAGNFTENIYLYPPQYTFKALPAFKHLVVDGNIHVMRESDITRPANETIEQKTGIFSLQWDTAIEFTGQPTAVGYKILAGYEDIVKTKIQNDTLYISFFKLHGENMRQPDATVENLLSVNNPTLKSLHLQVGKYRLNHIKGNDLSVKIANAGLNAENITCKKFKILADSAKWIDINSSRIEELSYALNNKSTLNLSSSEIKNFQPLNVDSLSKISVQGKAKEMEKYLPLLSASKNNFNKN